MSKELSRATAIRATAEVVEALRREGRVGNREVQRAFELIGTRTEWTQASLATALAALLGVDEASYSRIEDLVARAITPSNTRSPEPPAPPPVGQTRRGPTVLMLLVASVAALVVGSGLWMTRPEDPPAKPLPSLPAAATPPADELHPSGRQWTLAEDPLVEARTDLAVPPAPPSEDSSWPLLGVVVLFLLGIRLLLLAGATPGRGSKEAEEVARLGQASLRRALEELRTRGAPLDGPYHLRPSPLLSSADIEDLAVGLGQRVLEQGPRRLDVDATVSATIEAGGMTAPRFARRRHPAELTVLLDATDEAAPWRGRVLALMDRWRALGIEVERFDALREPLDLLESSGGRRRPLVQVSRDAEDRWLLVVGPSGLDLEGREVDRFRTALGRWRRVAWLLPASLLDGPGPRLLDPRRAAVLDAVTALGDVAAFPLDRGGLHAAIAHLTGQEFGRQRPGASTPDPNESDDALALSFWAMYASMTPRPTWALLEWLRTRLPFNLGERLDHPDSATVFQRWLERSGGRPSGSASHGPRIPPDLAAELRHALPVQARAGRGALRAALAAHPPPQRGGRPPPELLVAEHAAEAALQDSLRDPAPEQLPRLMTHLKGAAYGHLREAVSHELDVEAARPAPPRRRRALGPLREARRRTDMLDGLRDLVGLRAVEALPWRSLITDHWRVWITAAILTSFVLVIAVQAGRTSWAGRGLTRPASSPTVRALVASYSDDTLRPRPWRPALIEVPAGVHAPRFRRHSRIPAGLLVARTEVTQAQWRAALGESPSYHRGGDRPVERVSWYDVARYCNAISELEGLAPCYRLRGCGQASDGAEGCPPAAADCQEVGCEEVDVVAACTGYRVPTETEWWYSARAGAPLKKHAHWMTGSVRRSNWQWHNSEGETHPVAQLSPNPWGIHDPFGNVAELVGGPNNSALASALGGSFHESPPPPKGPARTEIPLSGRSYDVGFRPVRSRR